MKIILSGNPLSTQSIYKCTCLGGFPRLYMTKEGKDLKDKYRLEARTQNRREIMSGDCDVDITLFFKDKRRRDADNYNKLVLDSLEDIIFKDDRQIQTLTIKKDHSAENPRVEIEIKSRD